VRKEAYPNYSEYMPMSTVYNLERWTGALRDIYSQIRLGLNKTAATDAIVGKWPPAEKYNFSNWMKYYESGEVNKYKTAQFYVNDAENYYMPNPAFAKREVPSPFRTITDEINHSNDGTMPASGPTKAEIDARNNDFRRTLISRLNSIEKHLATSTAVDFFGKQYSSFIKAVHDLKHVLLTHQSINLSAETCVDLIIKQANILRAKNCPVGVDVMVKLAQTTPGNTGDLAMGATPVGGSIPQGLGNLGTPTPNLGVAPPGAAEKDKPPSSGIEGFLDNLEGRGITEGDELNNDDGDDDTVVMNEDEVEVNASVDESDDELIVIAQDGLAQEQAPAPKEKLQPRSEEVEAAPQKPARPKQEADSKIPHSDFDALVNSAFDKLTMEDLLTKLQDINLIFKRKEINRQLALADLMLSRLGLTPYFSNFSEVQQKNLDCLNYSATRMDDIISTLQSGLGKGKIDLTEGQGEIDPESQLLQRHLENEEKKDKDRKEMRKEVNNQKLQLDDSEKPEIEVESPGNELAEAPMPAEKPVVPAPKPKAVVQPGA
jgi:hypothetical protein